MRFYLAASVFAALGSAPALSQVAIQPGSSQLHTSRLRTGTDSFRIESSFNGTKRTATMRRDVTRMREGDRDLLVFAQRYNTPQGITVDTSWVDAATLAPVRYFADVYGEIQKFTFNGNTGSGTVTPRDSSARPVTVNSATPFFNAVALDLLYASLPLASDFSTTVALYNPPRASFTISLQVTGEEDLTVATGGVIKAWKLDYSLGPNKQTLWLDRRTGEFLRIGGTQGTNWFYKYRADLMPPTP